MKNKRLVIWLIVLAVVVAVVILTASILTVKKVTMVYHNYDGSVTIHTSGAPTDKDVLELCKHSNIVTLSKTKLTEKINASFTEYNVVSVVKHFPNKLEVHVVGRVPVFTLTVGLNTYSLDSIGYVIDKPATDLLDVSSAFEAGCEVKQAEIGKKLTFTAEKYNQRLDAILETVNTLWRCEVEMENIVGVLGKTDVFKFDGDSMTVSTLSGAKIVVVNATTDVAERVYKAFSAYYNNPTELQQAGVVITVDEQGNVISE